MSWALRSLATGAPAWLEEAGVGFSETSLLSVFACSSPQHSREGRRFPVLPYEAQAQEVKGPSQSPQPGRPGSQPTTHWNPSLRRPPACPGPVLIACSREGQLVPRSCLKLPHFSDSCLPVFQTPLEYSTKKVTHSACLCFPGISLSFHDPLL